MAFDPISKFFRDIKRTPEYDIDKKIKDQLTKQIDESLNSTRNRVYNDMLDNANAAATIKFIGTKAFYVQPGEETMPTVMRDRELFTIFKAENGFYARMENGSTVVGATLSEVCAAASACATDAAIRAEISPVQEMLTAQQDYDVVMKVPKEPKHWTKA